MLHAASTFSCATFNKDSNAVAYVEDRKASQTEGYDVYTESLQLSEGTPHILAWLEEHHPEVELIKVEYDG